MPHRLTVRFSFQAFLGLSALGTGMGIGLCGAGLGFGAAADGLAVVTGISPLVAFAAASAAHLAY